MDRDLASSGPAGGSNSGQPRGNATPNQATQKDLNTYMINGANTS